MKYGDKVKVTSGFYEGIEGIVIRENFLGFNAMRGDGKLIADIEITVRLEIKGDVHEVVFPESNLELIK